MKSFPFITMILALLTSGCVSSQRYSPHALWPKRVVAKNLHQFEGLYANRSLSPDTGKPAPNTTQLFIFILGPAYRNRGDCVQLWFTPDEKELKLRLLDGQNQEVESATLQRGVGFEFKGGRLLIRGPFSGLRGMNDNFGPGFTVQCDRLYLSTTGGILGSSSKNGMMLFMALIPTFVTEKGWWFWPKLED